MLKDPLSRIAFVPVNAAALTVNAPQIRTRHLHQSYHDQDQMWQNCYP